MAISERDIRTISRFLNSGSFFSSFEYCNIKKYYEHAPPTHVPADFSRKVQLIFMVSHDYSSDRKVQPGKNMDFIVASQLAYTCV